MKITEFLKKTTVVTILYLKKARLSALRQCIHDSIIYCNYSTTGKEKRNINVLKREIVINSHIIEKGLSHKKFKTYFGKEHIIELENCLKEYASSSNPDQYILHLGETALSQYKKAHQSLNCPVLIDILPNFESLLPSGIKSYTSNELLKGSTCDFKEMANSRHSIRLFDEKSLTISVSELEKALTLAQTAPSACNRQSIRTYSVLAEKFFPIIMKEQTGCTGFGTNVGAYIIVTSDLSYYNGDERRLPFVDGGIYTMNLVYSLFYYQLGSCILNASISKAKEQKLKELVNIPDNQILISIVAVSKVPPDITLKVPNAPRRDIKTTNVFIR